MDALPLAQKVKIIKETQLKIPVYRAPTENYDPNRPSKFDSHIMHESINVSHTISALIGIIRFLTKELLLTNKPFPKDTWKKLAGIKTLLRDQHNTIRR